MSNERDQLRQEHFSQAYLGLARQGFKQALKEGEDGGCVLLDAAGRRCAIGHLLEKPTINAIDSAESVALTVREKSFYDTLMSAHDNGYSPASMEMLLGLVASRYGLAIPYGPVQPC